MTIYGHGVTKRERQILDAQERGLTVAETAAEFDLRPSYVENVRSRFSVTAKEPWQDMARLGSETLLAQIRKHHPEMVP